MTAQQLKNSILQMAVQGKLVPQDPSDEPASVLLERIRTEKEQLIKQKKIKREKNPSYIFRGADNTPYEKIGNNEPVSIADEVPFEIPDSWEWVRCSSLGEIVRGSGIKRTETVADGLPCVRYGELYTTYNTSFVKTKSFITAELDVKCKHFGYGDILMTLTGENKPDIAKAVAYLGNAPVAAGGDLAYWTCHGMNPLYLVYALSCPYAISRKVHLATGDIIVHISGDKIGSILLPIPPLEEQARIVARIEEIETLLSKYDATEQQLSSLQSAFPDQLKKSILQMAVQGKLVPQDPDDEPASVLLERIRAEKQRLIAAGKIKRDKHESIIFRRDNSHYEKCGADEICIDDVIPFDIPESWIWVRLITLTEEKPANGYSPKGVGYATEVKNLTLTATTSGYFKSDAYKYVDVEIPSDSKYWLKHNDILIQRSNSRELVGTACVYTGEDNAFIYPDLMMRIRIMNGIDIRYIDYVLKSPFVRQYYTSSASGTSESMPKINQAIVSNTLIPLPPIVEQMRITKCIDKLLSRLTF